MRKKANQAFLQFKEMRQPFEWEELYKVWHIMSWIFLIFGYALTIVNGILFTDDPQMLYGLGIAMLSISLVNAWLMGLNLLFLLLLIYKEEGWLYYREYFWITVLYMVAFALLAQAALV